MTHTLAQSLMWSRAGQDAFTAALTELDDAALDEPSALPSWNGRQLVAHVAANADALRNLVRWAATGIETPMYATPGDRARGIDRGLEMAKTELTDWHISAACSLQREMNALDETQWARPVLTAQGRTLPALEIPWLRAREVMVHTEDLRRAVDLEDLPDDFVNALSDDIRRKRGRVPEIEGPQSSVTAWLAGRPHTLTGVSMLGPWL